MDASLVVVGSLNADLVFSAERMPGPGETVAGTGFAVHPGGKSANQAVAAARLGAAVRLVGAVGDDEHGTMLRAAVHAAGVDAAGVRTVPDVRTGVAGITVDAHGENSIVIVPGANALLSPTDVGAASDNGVFDGAAAVCLCFEVRRDTVLAAARAARAAGATVILNPSPYAAVPADLAECVDVLIVNAYEAGQMLGREGASDELGGDRLHGDEPDWPALRAAFALLGFERVIVTLGARGSVVLDTCLGADPDSALQAAPRLGAAVHAPVTRIEPTVVDAVDTTGAGDAFFGAVATRIAAGDSLQDAARFASCAAALATTRHGAQAACPTASEVDALLA
ncbi:ribokinase [Sinomonas notoginsengisoli]|uniref:ribokinase n=1 Tax=Sinomonas notoginsengisoli TaxID=1457311 RepID=UPI001F3B9BCE|nr:ribokinase [Sinomonas notoginsengisoli]